MHKRLTLLPSPTVLFLLFFSFTTAAALIFQNLLLPMMDSVHHGRGLIRGDSVYFHDMAVQLAHRIRTEGWSAWQMYPAHGAKGNVSLLAALYVLFGDNPSLMVPFNAALHALTGVLLFVLGGVLWPGRVGKLAGIIAAILFVVFPSSLNWYGQIHKDGFAIAGSMLIVLAWVRLDTETLNRRSLAYVVSLTVAGIFLTIFVRPYSLKIIILAAILMVAIGALINRHKWNRDAFSRCLLKLLIIALLGAGIALAPKVNFDSDTLYVKWESKNVVSESNRERLGEAADIILSWEWRRSDWIPAWVEGYAETLGRSRIGLVTQGLVQEAGSLYDIKTMPNSATEIVAYLPRGLQISLFAPFPSTWFEKLSATRLVAVGEMLVWYLVAPGVLLALWYRRRSTGLWSVLVFSLVIMTIYGVTLANIGTLYRMRYLQLFLLLLIGLMGWIRFFELRGWLPGRSGVDTHIIASPVASASDNKTKLKEARAGLLSSSISVAAIVSLSFLGLFLRDVLMARMFGLGDEFDAFVTATVIPMFLVAVFSVPLGTAIVPIFLEIAEKNSPESARALIRRVALMFFLSALLGALVLAWISPALLKLIGWTVMPNKAALVGEITCWVLAIFVFSGLVTLANGVLNAVGCHSLPAAAQAVVPVVVIAALLLFGNTYGVVVVVIAMFAGQLLNLVIVIKAMAKQGMPLLGRTQGAHSDMGGFVTQYLPLVAAAAFMQIGPPVGTAMASTLPPGSVAALGLGSKAVLFITGLAGAAITSAVLPYFSRHLAQSRLLDARRELSFLLLAGTVISIPLSILLYILSPIFVHLVFEGGAFDSADAELVSRVMAYGVLQLPFFIINILLLKFAIASRHSMRVLLASVIGLCVSVFFSLMLMENMGVAGIALAMTFAAVISAAVMMLLFCRLGDVASVDLIFIATNWGLFLTSVICLHYGSYVGFVSAAIAFVILIVGEWVHTFMSPTKV